MGLTKNHLVSHPLTTSWIAWFISRCLVVLAFFLSGETIEDVRYYFRGVTGTEDGALAEYPAVGVWPLWLIEKLNFGETTGFVLAFITTCVLVDAAFLALLHRHRRASMFWIVFGLAMPFVLYLRLDIFQGVLVALAAWFLATNPRISAALIGVAAMMKLWPAVLAAGLVDRFNKGATWIRIAYFAATCLIMGGLVAIFSGVDRLTSPLSYQQVRGLQIESLFATPFMVLSAFLPGEWQVEYATSKSFEIAGPGVDIAAQSASWSMYVVLFLALGWALWHFVRGEWAADSTLAWMVFIVLLLIASNKVFSPQYLLWVGPLMAVALARDENNRTVRRLAGLLTIMALLSTVIYPLGYGQLTGATTSIAIVLVLAARNALLIVTIVLAARYVQQTTPLRVGPTQQRELPAQPS